MNAVEIEAALSELACHPFDAAEFPYSFLAAFGHKDTTLKRLRTGNNNASDVPGGVLLRNNIHLALCSSCSKPSSEPNSDPSSDPSSGPDSTPDTSADTSADTTPTTTKDPVGQTLAALRASPATTKAKAKFILATDGQTLQAEDLLGGETIACAFADFPNHFGFFLSLAGISTVQEIKDNPIDVRATGRLNKLYVELLKENPDWAKAERRADMNHFMARLVFCFFAEDTDIFHGRGLFTQTVDQMSEPAGSNTHEVLSEIFRAMNVSTRHNGLPDNRHRQAAGLRPWADQFPYVNGGLFSGSTDVPRFTRMARIYLQHAGSLNWRQINPDIFGSMIQAVADDEERGALGMHYTSVPNILKVLNPLFLDELRAQLAAAGDNKAKLLNLRRRMARIRVFDPACGSGNFLVIAYKQMREIEAEINRRRGEAHLRSEIPVNNFRGIELRDFPAEIARLALIIAEYQCDVLYRGQKDAVAEFLPLDAQNWIVCGNALRLDWLSICPPTGTGVKLAGDDLFNTPLDQKEIDFANEGGETYICGNPPYLGSTWQSAEQKDDLRAIFDHRCKSWKSLDYVAGWFMKAADYGQHTPCTAAFVSTNSICQGEQVPVLWPLIFASNHRIVFAHTSFKWANLASHNAGVTVAIIGISTRRDVDCVLYSEDQTGGVLAKLGGNINAYLVNGPSLIVDKLNKNPNDRSLMVWGNKPTDDGNFFLDSDQLSNLLNKNPEARAFIRPYFGSAEFIRGIQRYCLWIKDEDAETACKIPEIARRINAIREFRANSKAAETRPAASFPHRFRQIQGVSQTLAFIVPRVSSERRDYLPIGLLPQHSIVADSAFALYDAPLWNMALIASRLHLVWIGTVCGKLETRYRYSNTLGWNTFPVPTLTAQNKADLTACAEAILLAREAHFPATIADLYDPKNDTGGMPANLRHAHERNDETLERIYIGRRFKNDTERLEKLFEMYTQRMKTAV